MKTATASALLGALSAISVRAIPADDLEAREVDTRYPYTGPAVPIGDCKISQNLYSPTFNLNTFARIIVFFLVVLAFVLQIGADFCGPRG